MPLPPVRHRVPPRKDPPPEPPVVVRRKKFQFPLYILIMMMTVIGMALAPASYFMRADANDHSAKMWGLIYMLASPMMLVIFIHTAFRLYQLLRKR